MEYTLTTHLQDLETKWRALLSKIDGIIIKQAVGEKLEAANTLLRYSYNFYRDSYCGTLPSALILYTLSPSLEIQSSSQLGLDGAEILDLSVPRKILLWAYTLVHGHYTNISPVLKHCEETAKIKKGIVISSASSHTHAPTSTATQSGAGKERDSQNECGGAETNPPSAAMSSSLTEADETCNSHLLACSSETQSGVCYAPQLHETNNWVINMEE